VVGDATAGPLLAEYLGGASATEEFLDRWREPAATLARRCGRSASARPATCRSAQTAWDDALKSAGLVADQVDRVVIAGVHSPGERGAGQEARRGRQAGRRPERHRRQLGAAQPAALLTAALEAAGAGPGDRPGGAGRRRRRAAVPHHRRPGAAWTPDRSVAEQAAGGAPIAYGKYLRWRGMCCRAEPPRRPEPARPSASAAGRSAEWKFGFVGSADDAGEVHLPPQGRSTTAEVPMADVEGTIVTFTVDRLAYSPSPPVVFAVVDFDGGGRLPVELTDVDLDEVSIGARVEMTFRRLFTADGIHNYFWKARIV
jgi:hydroxymethylglutaryl-CoA synthase